MASEPFSNVCNFNFNSGKKGEESKTKTMRATYLLVTKVGTNGMRAQIHFSFMEETEIHECLF